MITLKDGYEKLALAVILGGIKEQGEEFNIKGNQFSLTQEEMATEAKDWVASQDFEYWCKLIGANVKHMRSMEPALASKLYEDLITIVRKRGKKNAEESL